MHRARAFFYVSAGVFLLALSYHLGARNATAQAPGNPVVGIAADANRADWFLVMTANGDCYQTPSAGDSWSFRGNVFGGGPTPAQHESFGAVKSRYRGERGVAQPAGPNR